MRLTLGIDITSIKVGGGVTHIVELLKEAEPLKYGFEKIVIWGGISTLEKIEYRPWLVKISVDQANRSIIKRRFWYWFNLRNEINYHQCKILFVPGGAHFSSFLPLVTMSRNLLPFELRELFRYQVSWNAVRLILLRIIQSAVFRKASGVIYLNEYSKKIVSKVAGCQKSSRVIPHGVSNRFLDLVGRSAKPIEFYSFTRPMKILYVSTIDVFKHQWVIAEAVLRLREKNVPIQLHLVGGAYPAAMKRLKKTVSRFGEDNNGVIYHGEKNYFDLHEEYMNSDIGIFASSCENMPNILLELMASGLPIACSKYGPMPEILADAGLYFNPLEVEEVMSTIMCLVNSAKIREDLSVKAKRRIKNYSWKKCSDDTFQYLSEVAKSHFYDV